MRPAVIFRRLLLGIVALCLLTGLSASTWGGNTRVVTYQQFLSGTTDTFSFPAANHCGGEPREIRLTSDGSFRVTMLTSGPDAGFYWITPVQMGTFEIIPSSIQEPFVRGTFELQPDSYSARTEQITYVLHLTGAATDGTPFDTRLLEQLSVGRDKVTISEASPIFLSYQTDCA